MAWLAVAVGGAFGAVARYAVSQAFLGHGLKFPVATLLVNVLGSFLMGVIYVLIVEKSLMPSAWRPPIAVGFLGALTTFSTFSLEALQLMQRGQWFIAGFYVLCTVLTCLIAVACGVFLVQVYART